MALRQRDILKPAGGATISRAGSRKLCAVPGPIPTAYHQRLRATLAADEPGLFRWYSSDAYTHERAERMRLELLRSSYRLSVESHERPHRLARTAAERIGVTVPITLYQLSGSERNAALFFAPEEAHVGLSGPLLSSLDDAELTALFGHELSHHLLWTLDDGEYRVASELLEATAARGDAPPSFVESALRARRWTEVFADRGAAIACGSIDPVVGLLVKISTGLSHVSAKDYLAQAREVVDKLGTERRDTETHPEHAIRALALEQWSTDRAQADVNVAPWIEGSVTLETLDVVGQHALAERTSALLSRVLAPAWMRTDATLVHANRFFPEWSPTDAQQKFDGARSTSVDEYFAYVLLDFAVVDPALGEVALAHVLKTATDLELRDAIGPLARKELKLTASALDKLEARAADLALAAEKARAEEGAS